MNLHLFSKLSIVSFLMAFSINSCWTTEEASCFNLLPREVVKGHLFPYLGSSANDASLVCKEWYQFDNDTRTVLRIGFPKVRHVWNNQVVYTQQNTPIYTKEDFIRITTQRFTNISFLLLEGPKDLDYHCYALLPSQTNLKLITHSSSYFVPDTTPRLMTLQAITYIHTPLLGSRFVRCYTQINNRRLKPSVWN